MASDRKALRAETASLSAAPSEGAPTVLVTWPDYDVDHPDQGGALTDAGCRLRLAPRLGPRTPVELLALSRDATAAIVSTDPFTRSVLEGSPRLTVIARVGVGVDSIDLDAATERGIAVTITPGANEDTVADHTLALMLALLRRLGEHDAAVRRGEWPRTGPSTPRRLAGSTVGLVGFGGVGRRVAARLLGFSATVLAYDPAGIDDPRVTPVALDELLVRADVVSVHVPLTAATAGMIGRRELALLPSHALVVNTARGGVVDEEALAEALGSGRLGGAALDVFTREPPVASPLLGLANTVLSPHNAGLSTASIDEMTRRATASVLAVLQGRRPDDLANPAVAVRLPAGVAPIDGR